MGDMRHQGALSVLYHKTQGIVKSIVHKKFIVLAGCFACICKARVLVGVICARKGIEDTKVRGHCLQICAAYRCWEACVNKSGAPETQKMLQDYARGMGGRVDDILINHPNVDLDEVVSWSLGDRDQRKVTATFLNAKLANY